MLRSFVTLGQTLNLSETVTLTGFSRQTVRRHINELEKAKGVSLFHPSSQRYQLSEAGSDALSEAEDILTNCQNWISNNSQSDHGLARINYTMGESDWFRAQRHPVNLVWSLAPPLLQRGLKDWAQAGGYIDHRALRKVRKYNLLYRRREDNWICIEVGRKSSYATWMGWSHAFSSIGRDLSLNPKFKEADDYLVSAYDCADKEGGHWYDHVSARFPTADGGVSKVVNYQRLVSACRFPDGSPVISVLVARTNSISIDGLPPEILTMMPQEQCMEFDI